MCFFYCNNWSYSVDSIKHTVLLKVLSLLSVLFSIIYNSIYSILIEIFWNIKKKKSVKSWMYGTFDRVNRVLWYVWISNSTPWSDLEPYPICFELRGISVILLQCDVKHWSFVSPAAKFHLTGLVVKWEPSNINLESERKWYEGASIFIPRIKVFQINHYWKSEQYKISSNTVRMPL